MEQHIMRLIGNVSLLLAVLGLPLTTHAASLDPASGPHLSGVLIQSINTDKATYSDGDTVRLFVHLNNKTGTLFQGALTAHVTGRGVPVGSPSVRAIPPLAQGAEETVELDIPTSPMGNYQGYHVLLDAASNGNVVLDTQATAVDFSPDWWTYPRQCWLVGTFTHWGNWQASSLYRSPEQNITNLNAYHCNNLQFYNTLYRWHQPWIDQEEYINGDGQTQSVPLMRRAVGTAKRYHMGSLFYMPLYAANSGIMPNFTQDGSGASLNWGIFTNPCGANNGTCQLSDLKSFASNIAYMDPTNTDWQYYWAQQVTRVVNALGIDGIFVDTYGTLNGPMYNAKGENIDFSKAYSSFLNTVTGVTHLPMTLNPASSWNEQDLVHSNRELYHFTERWNNSSDISNYGTFWDKAQHVQQWASNRAHGIGMDWDLGMNKALMTGKSCDFNGGRDICTFNLPGVLYQEATILATGAHHAWIVDGQQHEGDGARFISNDDYPLGNMLSLPTGMAQAEADYQSFGVAYEKLLRRDIAATSLPPAAILSGPQGTINAQPGAIWLLQTHRPGFDILHLLNYQHLSHAAFNDVNDNAGNAAPPAHTGPLNLKLYVTPTTSLGRLYLASPDRQHGLAQTIPYSTGSDQNGNYILFSVPDLTYWDMLWVENDTTQSDYEVP